MYGLGRIERDDPHPGAFALVSALAMVGARNALHERPECAAMVLLPAFMLAAHAYADAPARRARLGFGAALVAHQARRGLGEGVEGEGLDEGHAAREGDHLGTRGHSEEGADLGGGHAAGACGVGIHPRIEP